MRLIGLSVGVAELLLKLRDSGKTAKLTKKDHATMVALGCDPTCHICQTKIEVGDQITARRLTSGVTGTVCEKCGKDPDAKVSKEELRRISDRSVRHAVGHAPVPSHGFLVFE